MGQLRLSLAKFANKMEDKLKKNDGKSGWDNENIYYLKHRLEEEMIELHIALKNLMKNPNDVMLKQAVDDECQDVANFAMMISDKLGLK